MEELSKQVEILASTLRLSIERMEQGFKLYSEKADELSKLSEETMILNEALTKSLSESDQAIDDLAKVTAALLTLQKQQQGEQAHS